MAKIAGSDTATKLQCGYTDQQIGEGKANALSLICAIDLHGTKGNRNSNRMDRKGREQFLDELLPLRFPLRRIGTGRTVSQFDQSDDETAISVFPTWLEMAASICRAFCP